MAHNPVFRVQDREHRKGNWVAQPCHGRALYVGLIWHLSTTTEDAVSMRSGIPWSALLSKVDFSLDSFTGVRTRLFVLLSRNF